jgi:hypothetical protein
MGELGYVHTSVSFGWRFVSGLLAFLLSIGHDLASIFDHDSEYTGCSDFVIPSRLNPVS